MYFRDLNDIAIFYITLQADRCMSDLRKLQNEMDLIQGQISPNAANVSTCSIQYFQFQPVLHNWCNKGRGMWYPACWMMHIKDPLLLIGKSSLCGSSRFPLSLSEWSFTINKKMLSASLNKIFPSFLTARLGSDTKLNKTVNLS